MVRFRLTAAICVMAVVALLLGGCMNEEASKLHPEGSNFLAKFFDALQTKAIYAAIETPEKEKNVLFDLAT